MSERFDRLQRWLLAVTQHEPGSTNSDDLLPPIGAWSRLELVGVLDDLKRFRTFLRRASQGNPLRPRTLRFEGHDFTKEELQELLGLSDVEAGNVNRLLKRGALLHIDIALNAAELGISPAPDPQGRRAKVKGQMARRECDRI